MKINERIKELREAHKLTQAKLAKAIGYSQPTIADWEKGNMRPTADAIIALAIFFEVSADYLLGLENEDGTRNTQIIKDSFNNISNSNIKF